MTRTIVAVAITIVPLVLMVLLLGIVTTVEVWPFYALMLWGGHVDAIRCHGRPATSER